MFLLTIQFFYGSFTLGFLVFLLVSYNALIEFFMSEAIFEENRDDDDTDESNPVDIEQDEVGLYDRMLVSPSFNYHLEELSFSFFRLFYLFGLIWLASFLGVDFFISSYFFFVFILYTYSFLNNYFKGRVLYSTARLDSFDPRPGFAADPVVSSPFVYLDFITVLNKNSSVLGPKVGLFYPLEALVHDRVYLDPLTVAFSKEPALFSKFNYFYIQFYILSSIHKYWTSILDRNFTLQRENALTPQASSHQRTPPFIFDSYSLLIGGEPFFLTSEILLRRFAIAESSRLYASLCFPSPFEKLGIRTGFGKMSFPFYQYRPRLLELVFSVLSKLLIRLSSCAVLSFSSTTNRGYFDSSSREPLLSYFRLFPPSYFFNWASFFFSSRLDYVSFRFKDTLISEDWQALSSFGDTPRKFSNFHPLPSFFSGKVSSFEILKNLLMRSPPFPASPDSHYYFVKGYLSFYTSEVLRLTRTLEMSYLYGPIRRYFMGVRYKNKRIEPGSYLSLRRSGYNSFSIRDWVGRSGDGLEPFLSPSSYFLFRASSFVRFSLARVTSQKKFILPSLMKGTGLFRLRSTIPKFSVALLSSDPSWKFLKQLVSHSPDLSLYMQNIVQNPLFSEFSKSFFKKYPDLFFDGSFKEALNVLGSVVRSRFREFTPPYALKPGFSAPSFSSSLLSKKIFVGGLFKACSPFSKTVKFRRNRFAGPKLLNSKSPTTRYFRKPFGKVINWSASRCFLSRGSLWSIVKMRSSCIPNFNDIRVRSSLRTLVRDPFGPYTQKLNSRSVIKFRRFFWRSCFERPVRALLLSGLDVIPHPILISKYLHFYLGGWLRSSFLLKSSFLVYVLSDFSLITHYFLSGAPHAIESARLWSLVWADPFSIDLWKIFFRCLFSQQTSFFMFFSSARFTGALKSNAYMSLYFSSNPSEALRFATLVRDSLILNFPNRLLSKLALKGSVFHRSVSTRGHWKFFSSTLSTLFYTLFSSLLRSGFREFFIPLSFFQLLKHYSSSVADYSHFVRHLFPSFRAPTPLDYSPEHNIDLQEEASLFDFTDRLSSIDWWQTFPSDSYLDHISMSLVDIGSKIASPQHSSRCVWLGDQGFLRFLSSPWSLSDRNVFFISAPSFIHLPSFFDPSLNRIIFLEKFPHTDFLLAFFKQEYIAYLGPERVARLSSISFYSDELIFDDDAELSEQGDEFYEVDDEFFDLDYDDEEETFEIEEEGTEDEQMLDPNRMLNASHPNIDDFDDVFSSEIPLKLSPVPWFSIIGQPTPYIYHERSGFFSFQSIYLGSFVLVNLPLRFTFFSLYCFFRNLFFFFTNFEFLEDYFRP